MGSTTGVLKKGGRVRGDSGLSQFLTVLLHVTHRLVKKSELQQERCTFKADGFSSVN